MEGATGGSKALAAKKLHAVDAKSNEPSKKRSQRDTLKTQTTDTDHDSCLATSSDATVGKRKIWLRKKERNPSSLYKFVKNSIRTGHIQVGRVREESRANHRGRPVLGNLFPYAVLKKINSPMTIRYSHAQLTRRIRSRQNLYQLHIKTPDNNRTDSDKPSTKRKSGYKRSGKSGAQELVPVSASEEEKEFSDDAELQRSVRSLNSAHKKGKKPREVEPTPNSDHLDRVAASDSSADED